MRHSLLLPLLTAALSLGLAVRASSEPMPGELVDAIERLDASGSSAWDYVRTAHDGMELRVERYEHGADDPWTLVSVDGIPASEKQRAAYAKDAEEREGRDHPGQVDVRSMIEPGTVELGDESESHAIYRFQPRPDEKDDAEVFRALSGTVGIDRRQGTIEWLQMENTEPFSPQIGVRIEQMLIRFEFAAPEEGRPGFIVAIRNDIDAKVAGIKSTKQRQSVRFHGFEAAE